MAASTIIRKMWGIGNASNIPLFLPYGIYGFQITIRAYEINTAPGVYDFEGTVGAQLDDIVAAGLQGGILLTVGQNTPTFILSQVGSFTTTGGGDNGPYPYYFNPVYINWYYDIYKRLFDFIASCSPERKACLQYIQVAEGSTGDAGPYKGNPTNYNWNGATSIQTGPGSEWSQYRKNAWAQFWGYNQQNASFCTLLFNPGNDNEDTDYIQDTYPDALLKNGITSHQIVFTGETATIQRIAIDRGELQNFFDDPNWSAHALPMNFTMFCSFIALQLDMPDSPTSFINTGGGDNNDLWDFGNRYLGIETADKIGMIALRDVPDFADLDRFPENGTWHELIDPTRLTQYNNRVAQLTAQFSDSPTYLAYLLNNLIATFLNPARESAVTSALASTGAQYDVTNPFINSFGVGMLLNYEKLLYQYDPNNTSRGWYNQQLDNNVLYGHFSRSTDHANGKDEMSFYAHADIISNLNYTITLRITYLDKPGCTWSLNYRDEYSPVTAFTNVNAGTNEWVQRIETIPNLQGKAYTNNTDFSIKWESGDDTPVALIEFYDVEQNILPDDPPTVVITTPDTVLTQPDNSIDVEAVATPAYLHSITLLWTLISGPATYTISSPTTANTTFGNLVTGNYVFRLTATQDDSQTAYDEITIQVVASQGGVKYIIRFKNRQQDDYRVELIPDDYSGVDKELIGADAVVKHKYQSGDGDIYSPIRASEVVIQFWTDGNISLEDFYNDRDDFWTVKIFGEKILNETANDILLFIGFLQLDNSGEDLQDRAHILTLNANDNLGLLKNIALPTPTDTQIYEGILLTDLLASILKQTSLNLETRAYLNIFENSTQDRSDADTIDFLQQTAVYTNNLVNSDGTYKNCFDILNQLLTTFRATLCQAFGSWVIFRQGEFRQFNNLIPGTLYDANFNIQDAILLDNAITVGRNENIHPINENQIRRTLRPFSFVKKTFNYNIPPHLIANVDLQLPAGATPYDTHTTDGIRYDDYSVATYFPEWLQTHGDTSYLEVAVDVATNNEIERYIVTPCPSPDAYRGIQFNNIPVTKDDSFDFSLQFRTFTDSPDNFRFTVRFDLITADGNYWTIDQVGGVYHWEGPFNVANWDLAIGVQLTTVASSNSSQWLPWSLASFFDDNRLPLIPADGILLIEVRGNNTTNPVEPHITTLWKSISLNFTNAINKSLNVIGQYHLQEQPSQTKNNSDTELDYDDSPRNTIEGTLLRVPLVDFEANINELYFYRTLYWHRGTNTEEWRLNQIQTFEQLFIQRKIRTIIEGDWFGVRYQIEGGWQYLSLLNILKINFLQNLNFIFGILEIDYMTAQWNAALYELWDDDEVDGDLDNTYTFNYIYKTT